MTQTEILAVLERHATPTAEDLARNSFAELTVGEVIDSSLEMIELMMNIENDLGISEDAVNQAGLPSRAPGMTFGELAMELVKL